MNEPNDLGRDWSGTVPGLVAAATAWRDLDPDPETRAAMDDLIRAGDAEVLADHVGRRLTFGTAGLRAGRGPGPNRMNRLVVRQAAEGLARCLLEELTDARDRGVVVGRDARHGSADFATDVVDVLTAHGIRVHAFGEAVPTPLVAFACTRTRAAAAVVITASHNPAGDNGMKVYWEDGAQIVAPIDEQIARAIDAVATEMSADLRTANSTPARVRNRAPVTDLGSSTAGSMADDYVASALRLGDTSRGAPIRIAATPLHGVGAGLLERVLVGAGHRDLHLVADQRHPDPDFPTVRIPNPEEPRALDHLLDLAREVDAHVALANDPDADRLAVAVRDRSGDWSQLTGDQVGVLLARHLLGRTADLDDRLLVCTVVSSGLLARVAEAAGAHFAETLTGFKWLCRPGLSHPEWHQVLLYEEALGYAIGPECRDKDGITAALVMCDLMAGLQEAGRTVDDELDDLARRHGAHVTDNGSVGVAGPGSPDRLAGLIDRLVDDPPVELGGWSVVRRDRPAADVLRLWLADGTRVAIRPSGTEPKLKYYCEAMEAVGDDGVDAARHRARDRLTLVVRSVTGLVT